MNKLSVRCSLGSSCDCTSVRWSDMRCVLCLRYAGVLIACLKFPPQRTETCVSSSIRWPRSSLKEVQSWRRRPWRTTETIPCSREFSPVTSSRLFCVLGADGAALTLSCAGSCLRRAVGSFCTTGREWRSSDETRRFRPMVRNTFNMHTFLHSVTVFDSENRKWCISRIHETHY